MKSKLRIIGLIILVGICLVLFFYDPNKLTPENPAGKDEYYTMITGSGTEGDNERYNYEVIAYDEHGEQREVNFSSSKQLREGAYVQLLYAPIRGVTYWEEVTFEELPEEVQQQY